VKRVPPAPGAVGARVEPVQRSRPGFPARLPGMSAAVAAQAVRTSTSLVTTRPVQDSPASASVPGPLPVRPAAGAGLDSTAFRAAMVRRLQAQGLVHAAVVAAMQAIERHRFVDSALIGQAYEDTSLPIGLGQTISKPSVVARMAELLCEGREVATPNPGSARPPEGVPSSLGRPGERCNSAPNPGSARPPEGVPSSLGRPGERFERLGRVLEIGTGCGYQAAVLSHLSREVYSIERLRGLHEKARENLRWFRLSNVHLLFGDGMLGFERGAPYAGIIAAAGGDAIPQAWLDQLAVGGRLVAPARSVSGQQHLVVVDRTPEGLVSKTLDVVNFVPLKSSTA
jgi:protein-L-isoaspartate(D-aspartate) O-methyltransferase